MSYIEKICATHTINCETTISINEGDPTSILVPPRNLQELKDYDQYQYENLKKNTNKIIEL